MPLGRLSAYKSADEAISDKLIELYNQIEDEEYQIWHSGYYTKIKNLINASMETLNNKNYDSAVKLLIDAYETYWYSTEYE